MMGFVFGIQPVQSLFPQFGPRIFITAVAFTCSGIILYAIVQKKIKTVQGEIDILIVALSFVLMLIVGIVFMSSLFHVNTGIERLFLGETMNSIQAVSQEPSEIGTNINFLCIILIGLFDVQGKKRSLCIICSGIIIGISIIALVGYSTAIPALYYDINGISTKMNIPVAVVFILLGGSFLYTSITMKEYKNHMFTSKLI